MAQVIWAPQALDDLEAIVNHIARDAPATARRFAQKIVRRIDQLALFPASGSYVLEDGSHTYREVLQGNYRIIYRVNAKRVVIVAVYHAARLLDPSELPSRPERSDFD
jgi:toxin ParE1/3/4